MKPSISRCEIHARPVEFLPLQRFWKWIVFPKNIKRKRKLRISWKLCLMKSAREETIILRIKKSVVRDKKVHEEVIEMILSFCLTNGFTVLGLTYSPLKGPEGNIEYLTHIKKVDIISNAISDTTTDLTLDGTAELVNIKSKFRIHDLVEEAHAALS